MKKVLSILFFAAVATACSQKVYEPQIIVLKPYEVKFDKAFTREIDSIDKALKAQVYPVSDNIFESPEFKELPAHIQVANRKSFDYMHKLDFNKSIGLEMTRFLFLNFYEDYHYLTVTPQDTSVKGNIDELKGLASKTGFRYIVNIPSAEFYKADNKGYLKIHVQLYDDLTKTIVFEKSFTGDRKDPGYGLSCPEGSIQCMLTNAISEATSDMEEIISAGSEKEKNRQKSKEE